MSVPNFTNFPSEVSGALLSGSNGVRFDVVTGTPDKIVGSLTAPLFVPAINTIGIGGNPSSGYPSLTTLLEVTGAAAAYFNLTDNLTSFKTYTAGGNVYLGSFTNSSINIYTNSSEKMRIEANGNVGIGTTSPATRLDVQDAASISIRARETVNGIDTRLQSIGGAGNAGIIGTFSNHPLVVYTNNSEKIRVESGGNVGIGTSSPSQKLSVNGNISADGIVFGSTGVFVTSKTLEDYEEGTWTPGLQGSFVTSPTFTDRYGYYIKTGKLVNLWFFIHLASSTGAGGTLEINGLPYTAGPAHGQATLDYINGFNTAFSASITGYSYSTIYFNKTIAGSSTNLTSTDTTTDFIIYGTANFRTS